MKQDVLRVIAPTTLSGPDGGSSFSVLALFWRSRFLAESDFLHHLPFLFWLIDACRPRRYVELGVGNAVSYFAACQAIDKLVPGGRCYGIDNWTDEADQPEMPESIRARNAETYAEFSKLTLGDVSSFHENFQPSSIDLLMISKVPAEGWAEEFNTAWEPKLSDRAVILFNGTSGQFAEGSAKALFNGLRSNQPHICFEAGTGLAAILWGKKRDERLLKLAELSEREEGFEEVHQIFSRLGAAHHFEWLSRREAGEARLAKQALESIEQRHIDHANRLAESEAAYDERAGLLADLQSTLFDLRSGEDEKSLEIQKLSEAQAVSEAQIASLTEALEKERARAEELTRTLAEREAKSKGQAESFDAHIEEIAALTRDLAIRQEELAAVGEELNRLAEESSGRRVELEGLTDQLDAREAEIQSLSKKYEESSRELGALQAGHQEQLDARDKEIKQLTARSEEAAGELAALQAAQREQLDARDAEIGLLTAKLDESNRELGSLQEELGQSASLAARLKTDLVERRTELEGFRKRLAMRDREKNRMAEENAGLLKQLAEQQSLIEILSAGQETAREEAAIVRARIERLKKTASWRITEPIRWTRRVARRSMGIQD